MNDKVFLSFIHVFGGFPLRFPCSVLLEGFLENAIQPFFMAMGVRSPYVTRRRKVSGFRGINPSTKKASQLIKESGKYNLTRHPRNDIPRFGTLAVVSCLAYFFRIFIKDFKYRWLLGFRDGLVLMVAIRCRLVLKHVKNHVLRLGV